MAPAKGLTGGRVLISTGKILLDRWVFSHDRRGEGVKVKIEAS